jgi:hypothetical protein
MSEFDSQEATLPVDRSRKRLDRLRTSVQAGVFGGLAGGITIWIYEALVWVGVQHLLPLSGIPPNATGLVFGKQFQWAIGAWAYPLGTTIHFAFAIVWGVLFAMLWPMARRRGYEATLIAIPYAALAWVVMHVAISITSNDHPNYYDPAVIIGGVMSHIFFTVPMALVVKHLMHHVAANEKTCE